MAKKSAKSPPKKARTVKRDVRPGTIDKPVKIAGRDIDFRTDLYAMGCIVHEMVTGKRAFLGTSLPSIIGSHIDDVRPVLPGKLVDGSAPSVELRALHGSLLAKELAKRPESTVFSG